MSDPGAGRWTLGGAAVLMACACATSTQTAKAASLTGFGATTTMVHPAARQPTVEPEPALGTAG